MNIPKMLILNDYLLFRASCHSWPNDEVRCCLPKLGELESLFPPCMFIICFGLST